MKKIITLLMILVLALSLVACTTKAPVEKDPVVEAPVDPTPVEPAPVDPAPVNPAPSTDSKEVKLFFVNEAFIQSGDESLEQLVSENRTLEFGSIPLEEAIVKALMNGAEEEGLRTVIPATAKLLGVEVADGTAFVNFAQEGMFGGSMEETFTINQIVVSLVDLDSVDRVQFLLDGKKGESLMGHYGIEEPFEKPLSE